MHRTTKRTSDLTLHDVLSHLDRAVACKLLGPDGSRLIQQGGRMELDPYDHVELSAAELLVRVDALRARPVGDAAREPARRPLLVDRVRR